MDIAARPNEESRHLLGPRIDQSSTSEFPLMRDMNSAHHCMEQLHETGSNADRTTLRHEGDSIIKLCRFLTVVPTVISRSLWFLLVHADGLSCMCSSVFALCRLDHSYQSDVESDRIYQNTLSTVQPVSRQLLQLTELEF